MEKLLDGFKLWNQWGKQRRFAYPLMKRLPSPKSPQDFHKAYLANKQYLYNVKSVQLQLPKKGPGATGIRHFKYFVEPPLRYWNPDVTFQCKKVLSAAPQVTLELEDGSTKVIEAAHLREREILTKILELTNSPRTLTA
eukprot:TRINITY_DN2686_c0_g1_i1.p1 TRINITY_DN2686_c0_g1~~TRINITY_DN2686_c0_g1_i1.p1  ORF type:complete len:139 (-),score=14.59 TRINITY_DN2686_c0_g1_i1:34-450(-)